MATILVVDDSSIARKNLSTILTNAGHRVIGEALNGEIAYIEYEKYLPDIVTMDITMPTLDGIGAVKKIMKRFPDANIIMVSALDQKGMILSAIQCGAKHYIIKPFTAEKVIKVVNEVFLFSANSKKLSVNNNSNTTTTINSNNNSSNSSITNSNKPASEADNISTLIDDLNKELNLTGF